MIQLKKSLIKVQENHNLGEKRSSTDANIEMNQMLKLSDNVFKAVIIKILQ